VHKPRDIRRLFSFRTSQLLPNLQGVNLFHKRFLHRGVRLSLGDINEAGLNSAIGKRICDGSKLFVPSAFELWHLLGLFFHFKSCAECFLSRFILVGCSVITVLWSLMSLVEHNLHLCSRPIDALLELTNNFLCDIAIVYFC
jgi:hypothetical protein